MSDVLPVSSKRLVGDRPFNLAKIGQSFRSHIILLGLMSFVDAGLVLVFSMNFWRLFPGHTLSSRECATKGRRLKFTPFTPNKLCFVFTFLLRVSSQAKHI